MDLRFTGAWNVWFGGGLALALGMAAWALYRRETSRTPSALRWLLPLLRALAVFLIVLMLTGPVLHHRKVVGQLSRLLLFVDGSQSMDLHDKGLDIGRKVLILLRLGWLPAGAVQTGLADAADALARARRLKNLPMQETPAMQDVARQFAQSIGRIADELARSEATETLKKLRAELLVPAQTLAANEVKTEDQRIAAEQELGRLADLTGRFEKELQTAFGAYVAPLAGVGTAVGVASERFDALPRLQRVQMTLLEGDQNGLLTQLFDKFEVQLFALRGTEAEKIWQPGPKSRQSKSDVLPIALPAATAPVTNLSEGIRNSVGERRQEDRGAVVLFSDGRHNDGASPLEMAKIFGDRGLPLYTVGYGGSTPPPDLAIMKIEGPESVFFEDRVTGILVLKDDIPAGRAFTVTIRSDDKAILWEQNLTTQNSHQRKVPFDFPIAELTKTRVEAAETGAEIASLPLHFQADISAVTEDSEEANNHSAFRVRAITQRRKLLLIDGRPRWEMRYLRNLFERDKQWEVTTLVAGVTRDTKGWERGAGPGQFPDDAETLDTYDLIFFGEVPRSLLSDQEIEWLRKFVANRGGGVVFIDGQRKILQEYQDTALGELLPVEWSTEPAPAPLKLQLTEPGVRLAAFTLTQDTEDNGEIWAGLRPPHWLASSIALPGTETLVEGTAGDQRIPAVVLRNFGAGKVLYCGFDESWRWRHNVGDLHHQRFWNQIAAWMAELPFAVKDKFVSLDAGAVSYQPGDIANLRVRLRDGEGRPVSDTAADAELYRDGIKVSTVRLEPDINAGGLFRGKTGALEPGSYEVMVNAPALPPSELGARVSFEVRAEPTAELLELNANEDLLRQMAETSGGTFLREEEAQRLPQLLEPLSQGRVIESETVLWQSYWWFMSIILLLTAEWILRKRAGMV